MKIGLISQWYEPETGSAAHPTAIAKALAGRGHEVKVLTGFPNYPLGRLYDGWTMKARQIEVRDGITLCRVPNMPSHDNSALRRGLTLTSFAASATAQVGWLRDVDVCLTYLSPATVGLAARVLRRSFGVPYVLYVQDLWPESVFASGFVERGPAVAAAERGLNYFLRRLYQHASSIAALSPTMQRTLRERSGSTPVDVIYNWVDEATFRPCEPRRELPTDRTWIMYAGGIGDLQGLDSAVAAIGQLEHRPDIGLALVGEGVAVAALRRQAEALGVCDRVAFLGHRPMEAMSSLMADSAAQLVSLRDLPLFRGTVPSKLQASMASGQPVICSVAGDAAEVARAAGSGPIVVPGDVAGLASAFEYMADLGMAGRAEFGAAARRYYVSEMSAAVGAARMEEQLVAATRNGQARI
jgi:glycosyltransferase involved in cell wall biosynthesis